jgi:hypothetical protein
MQPKFVLNSNVLDDFQAILETSAAKAFFRYLILTSIDRGGLYSPEFFLKSIRVVSRRSLAVTAKHGYYETP